MANTRALRYRRLSLAENDKGKADLLLKLADESDRGILCTSEWLSARLSLQEERLQDAKVRFGWDPLKRMTTGESAIAGYPRMVPPNLLLTGQRAVIGGEALNATFGPANCPPTNSATSNAAASKLPPITAKKPMLDFWCAISRSRTTTTQGVHRIAMGGMASRSYLLSPSR
jgi:hypothetical protein